MITALVLWILPGLIALAILRFVQIIIAERSGHPTPLALSPAWYVFLFIIATFVGPLLWIIVICVVPIAIAMVIADKGWWTRRGP